MSELELIPRHELVASYWARGLLVYKLAELRDDTRTWAYQLPLYGFLSQINREEPRDVITADVHRQFGKSNTAMMICIELALRGVTKHGRWRPARITYIAPTATQLGKYLVPIIVQILSDCPPQSRPARDQSGAYVFPNGSTINLDGGDGEHKEAIRGRSADLVVIDEARDISDLKYLIESIVLPLFRTTGGRLIVISTPPRSTGHYFVDLANQCKLKGDYFEQSIYQRPDLTREEILKEAAKYGGEQSNSWRREYGVEYIQDEDTAVVPEWTKEKASRLVQPHAAKDWQEPYYRPLRRWISMDPGRKDYTGIIYGYCDFKRAKIIVQRERIIKRMLVDDLVEALVRDQAELWPGLDPEEVQRISDQNDVLFELAHRSMHFIPTSKVSKEEMVANLRDAIQNELVEIDPGCAQLISELGTACWSRAKDKFIRPESGGHFDLLDALIYAWRNRRTRHNPYPDPYVVADLHRQHVKPEEAHRYRKDQGLDALVPDPSLDW